MICVSSHTIDETILPEKPMVLDVGSRRFGFTEAILKLRPLATVHAIEPDPVCHDPGIPNVHFHSLGLVHDDRRDSGYASFSTGEGNYLTYLPWKVHDAKIMTVPTMNLADFTQSVGVQKWDVIKFDCEGAEFLIMENWPQSVVFGQISVEFHDFNTLDVHNDAYYQGLCARLKVVPRKFNISECGPGIKGHWDCLLVPR